MEETKTKKVSMKERINSVIGTIGTELDIDLLKPVLARMKDRLKKIKSLSQATHTKINVGGRSLIKTIEPKMFIQKLDGTLVNNVATITYGVYETDGKNKKLYESYADIAQGDGTTKKKLITAQYRTSHLVVETIEFRKPIKTKIIDDKSGDLL